MKLNKINWTEKKVYHVVIYGASMYGKLVYDNLKKRKNIDIIGCLDKKHNEIKNFPILVSSPGIINNMEFDYIIIASVVEHVVLDIYSFLTKNNIRDEQIVLIRENDFKPEEKIFFMEDVEFKNYIREWEAYIYLREKYSNYVELKKSESGSDSGITWLLWLQGWENAPELIQKCRDSVIKYNSDRKIVFLDKKNVENYIEIPDDIKQMYQNGIICAANFSDIIRLELLKNYGGLWLDATVFLSGMLDEFITESPLFIYRFPKGMARTISSWFIYAHSNNIILKETLRLLYIYWRVEKRSINYYAMHLLFRIVSDVFVEEWENIPSFYNANCFILQKELNKPYKEQTKNLIFKTTNIHKLNHHLTIDCQNSLYEHI